MGRHKSLDTYSTAIFRFLQLPTAGYPFYGRGQAHKFSPAAKIAGQRLMWRLSDSAYTQGCLCSITTQAAIFYLQRLVYCPPANKLRFCRSGAAERNGCASRPTQRALSRAGLGCRTAFSWLSGRFPVDVRRPCANVGEEYQTHNGARRVEAVEHDSGWRR
jgi:hypothetical protein